MSKQIMYDSDEAAEPCTVEGWLASDGSFHLTESAARYTGCTHRPCRDCGKPAQKYYTVCKECRDKLETARFFALPAKPWDGKVWLYSDSRDQYFASPEDAEDCLEADETIEDLRLLICEPNYVRPLESDYFCDEIADDDLPSAVEDAMDDFNKAVAGIVLSWSPSKFRLA
jgi:hypothetical protein